MTMKKISTLIILSLVFITGAFAQWTPTANLTVFSDDGSKFYLILNGEKYNNTPQTNIRLEELPNPYYSCKIIFEDNTKPSISKNIQLTDADGKLQDVTYKIKPSGNGKYVLRFYSMIPAEQNMVRPSNCTVYQYGQPNIVLAGPGFVQTSVQQTTTQHANTYPASGTTQTTTQQTITNGTGNNANVNVNLGGVGVNMNVNIPTNGVATSSTTTTTTTTGSAPAPVVVTTPVNAPTYQTQGCSYPMAPAEFEEAKKTIAAVSFNDTRLATAEQIISTNCMNVNQITAVIKLFSFESTKVEFAKYAYDYCVDQKSYYKVVNSFSFDSSKTELNEYLQGKH